MRFANLIWIQAVVLLALASFVSAVSCSSDFTFTANNANPVENDIITLTLTLQGGILWEESDYRNTTVVLPAELINKSSAFKDLTAVGIKDDNIVQWQVNASTAGSYFVNVSVMNTTDSVGCTDLAITVQPPIPSPYFNMTVPDLDNNLLVGQTYTRSILFENSGAGNGTITGTINSPSLNITDTSFTVSLEDGASAQKSFTFTPNSLGAGNITVSVSAVKNSADDTLAPLSNFYIVNNDGFNVSGILCVENWVCGDWSSCSDGIQTRTCSDANVCGTVNSKPALSQTCTVSSNSGGSGGSVALPSRSFSWQSVVPEKPAVMKVIDTRISISQIDISVLNALSNVQVKVDIANLPESIKAPEGAVYQFIEFTHVNINDSDIGNIIMSFNVPKIWISENNITEADIVLMRYHDREWDELSTEIKSSDKEKIYYSASSPGLSYFAIGKKAGAVEEISDIDAGDKESETSEATEGLEDLGKGQIDEEESKEETSAAQEESEKQDIAPEPVLNKTAIILVALVCIAVLLIALFVWFRSRD
jgi:PGF-pre-PGF domain-containing protein